MLSEGGTIRSKGDRSVALLDTCRLGLVRALYAALLATVAALREHVDGRVEVEDRVVVLPAGCMALLVELQTPPAHLDHVLDKGAVRLLVVDAGRPSCQSMRKCFLLASPLSAEAYPPRARPHRPLCGGRLLRIDGAGQRQR